MPIMQIYGRASCLFSFSLTCYLLSIILISRIRLESSSGGVSSTFIIRLVVAPFLVGNMIVSTSIFCIFRSMVVESSNETRTDLKLRCTLS